MFLKVMLILFPLCYVLIIQLSADLSRGHESNSCQIIKKVKIKVCTSASPIIISIIFSPLLFILSHMGVTSLGHSQSEKLRKDTIDVSRCCIRTYDLRGRAGRPKSLPLKDLRRKTIRV